MALTTNGQNALVAAGVTNIQIEDLRIRADGTTPVVNSRVLAEMFEKEHRNVLRDIDAIVHGSVLSDGWFREVREQHPTVARRKDRSFDMTRDGFTLLAMGWTGDRAMAFKVRYIQAFNVMERTLREAVDPLEILRDPAKAIQLIGEYASRLQIARAATEEAVMQRDSFAAAHDRFASHGGTFNVTVTAKTLDVPPAKLFAWLAANQWIYRPGGRGEYAAYQTRIQQGLLIMATHEIKNRIGDVQEVARVRVTTKGLSRLSRELGQPINPAQVAE